MSMEYDEIENISITRFARGHLKGYRQCYDCKRNEAMISIERKARHLKEGFYEDVAADLCENCFWDFLFDEQGSFLRLKELSDKHEQEE